MARVLITREFDEPLASAFRNSGHDVLHVPLVSLVATGESAPAGKPSAVLVTSQAVARFVPDLAEHIGAAPVFSVGKVTAESLKSIGVDPCHVGWTDGVAALAAIDEPTRGTVWFVGAAEPSDTLAKALDEAQAKRWPVYRNERPQGYANKLLSSTVDAVAFTSASAIRAYVDVMGVRDVAVIALGERTAAVAAECGFADIRVPPTLGLAGMADMVDSGV